MKTLYSVQNQRVFFKYFTLAFIVKLYQNYWVRFISGLRKYPATKLHAIYTKKFKYAKKMVINLETQGSSGFLNKQYGNNLLNSL